MSSTRPAATISDFKVSTSEDVLPTAAAPYTIGASASPGVNVSVSPTTPERARPRYSISNVRATGELAGGSSTITIVAPTRDGLPQHRLALQRRGLHDALGLGRRRRPS